MCSTMVGGRGGKGVRRKGTGSRGRGARVSAPESRGCIFPGTEGGPPGKPRKKKKKLLWPLWRRKQRERLWVLDKVFCRKANRRGQTECPKMGQRPQASGARQQKKRERQKSTERKET